MTRNNFKAMFASMSDPKASLTKEDLRRRMRDRLGEIPPGQRMAWSGQILSRFTSDDEWIKSGGVVALFGGLKNEPNLLPLLPWLKQRGLAAAFFAIEGDELTPYLVRDEQDFIPGTMGVLEPKRGPSARLPIADLSVVLVPGLAFGTEDGSRLGRGKGYYDRVLGNPEFRGRSIGICYAMQLMPTVPREAHDVCVHALVNESGWLDSF